MRLRRADRRVLDILADEYGWIGGYDLFRRPGRPRLANLYVVLERLRAAGLIDAEWQEPDALHSDLPRRRMYAITQAGRRALRG